METIEVKAVKLKDINEKDLMYVTISKGSKRESINVGEKTWNRINDLIKEKEVKKEVEEKKK